VSAPARSTTRSRHQHRQYRPDDRRRDRLVRRRGDLRQRRHEQGQHPQRREAWTYTPATWSPRPNQRRHEPREHGHRHDRPDHPRRSPVTRPRPRSPRSRRLDHQDRRPASVSAPGTLNYTILVTNTGNTDLTTVGVTDSFAGGRPTPAATRTRTASSTSARPGPTRSYLVTRPTSTPARTS